MRVSELISQLQSALDQHHSIILGARCEINYSGRAESHLPKGDRTIMIKPDNTLLVHQPFGSKPVNYMKELTTHEIKKHKRGALLQSKNTKLKEYMDIIIESVHFFSNHDLEDGEKIQLLGTEKHMAEHIMNNPHVIDEHFTPITLEEQTKFGFIDVFGHDKDGTLVIVECKRYTADLSAVTQLRRYVEKVKQAKGLQKVKGILASPAISKNARDMLIEWGFEHKMVKPPKHTEQFDKSQQKLV